MRDSSNTACFTTAPRLGSESDDEHTASASEREVRLSTAPKTAHRAYLDSHSHLSMDEYHIKADKTMEDLLETLEELLDAEADTGFEVDYHVSPE
jgi:hypothetical protein